MGNRLTTTDDNRVRNRNDKETTPSPTNIIEYANEFMQMVQNVLLIWLDNSIDEGCVDTKHTITQLRRAVNTVKTFTDTEQCIGFIENVGDEKVFMLTSGSLGQQIVPRLHKMTQVDSIFIFCSDQAKHEQWAKDWSKIKSVSTDIKTICEALKEAAKQCEQNSIRMSLMNTGDNSKKGTDQLDQSFMYTQIFKEILLTIQFDQKHITEFTDHCRILLVGNEDELKNVQNLEKTYRPEKSIWWYTSDCFLHFLLNRALRQMNVELIIKMGFFIKDLHCHIAKLHKEQFNGHDSTNSFIVYRGQGMSKNDFKQMNKNKGGLTSFNNFLSTDKNDTVALNFAKHAATNPDLVGVLFVMKIDPRKSTAPFAAIKKVAYSKHTEEILFSTHTVFRICDIKPVDGHVRLFQVELKLTDETDKALHVLTNHLREESFPHMQGWYRLGLLLLKLGYSAKAQQIYEILLNETTDDCEKASIYNQLGKAKYDQGKYQEAITFYEKSLEIDQQTLRPQHPDLAYSYGEIGNVYFSMGEYAKARSSHEKALQIRQKSLPPNHPDLASSYNNLGEVFRSMGEYPRSFSFYEKSLEIKQQSLPPNHPNLGSSYNNIGNVYYDMTEYSKALSSYEKSLQIFQKCLPSNHPDLATCYDNIGAVHEKMGNIPKAISCYASALKIGQDSLPSNHPSLQRRQANLDRVKGNF